MFWEILTFFIYHVVLARPTDSNSSQEHQETEEDSGPSSTEECNPDDVSKSKENSKPISDNENVLKPNSLSPLSMYSTVGNKENIGNEYDSPRPPDLQTHLDCGSHRHEWAEIPREQLSALSIDRHPSEYNTDLEEVSKRQTAVMSFSTLSRDDLTMDARACARPRRKNKGSDVKKADKMKLKDYGHMKKEDNPEMDQRKGDGNNQDNQDSIEDLIKKLVAEELPSEPKVSFFDAAIVYEKEDYNDAMNFKEEMLMIVKSEYKEEIRIELFDSVAFAQSKVCVVQDVIDKCSLILVYLTKNFGSPELKFFVEEAIGICRLGLGNNDPSSGLINKDRQWLVKPVHTAPPKMRAYKIPSGLLTINGIDWYDKHSPRTRQQIRAVVRTAYNSRKQKEFDTCMSSPQFNLPRPGHMTWSEPRSTTKAKDASELINMNRRTEGQTNSNTSLDALSFVGNMSQPGFSQGHQNTFRARENISLPGQHIPPMQAHHQVFPQTGNAAQYFPVGNPYGQMYTEQDAYQFSPAHTLPHNQLQTGQYHSMPSQANQYLRHQGYQQTYAQHNYPVQSASIQGRHAQPLVNGNISHHLNEPVYPGYVQTHNIYPQVGIPQDRYHEQLLSSQNQGQNFSGISFNTTSRPRQSSPQFHEEMLRSNRNFPLLGRQQAQNLQQQNQPLSRDAYPSEPGNFLRDQRNDALPPSQLSVVSKVTGDLIVNPNLSTDDVEVDHYVGTEINRSKPKSKNSKARHKRSSKKYESTDSEESSSDCDSDDEKPWKGKRGKGKVYHVVGSKIVQIGKRNKVIESDSNYPNEFEKPSNYEQLRMKDSTGRTENLRSRISVSEDSIAQQFKAHVHTTSESIISADNMSVDRSLNKLNTNNAIREKSMNENIPKHGKAPVTGDNGLEDHHIEVVNVGHIERVNISPRNIKPNDQYSRGYSEKASSIQYHGSEFNDSRGDNFNDNEDNLFESGSYNSSISNGNEVQIAPFTFSKAREKRANLIKGSSSFLKLNMQDMIDVTETCDID